MGILRRLSRWMGKQDHMTHIIVGNTAPGFSLKSLDNKDYSLAALLERGPVVAAFFKISCPVCQFTFPFLERLNKRYGGGATFLGISQDDGPSTTKFAKEFGITFPILIDDENGYVVSNAYGLTSVPTVFWKPLPRIWLSAKKYLGRRSSFPTKWSLPTSRDEARKIRSGRA